MKSSFTIDGAIHNDTTWASNTIMVNGDIFVPDTVTLTINPGTVVLFNDWYTIDVQGQLLAIGAINDSIIFKPADTSGYATFAHTGWPGIKFDSTISADTSVISFCIFEFAKRTSYYDAAVYVNDFSNLIIEKSRFSHNYNISEASCIQIENESSMLISGNVFTYNYSYHSCVQLGCSSSGDIVNPLIENNIFRYNRGLDEGSCMKLSGYNRAMVVNNTCEFNYSENRGGAIVISGHASPTLIGNLISNNYAEDNGGGIAVKYHTDPKLINNTIVYNHSVGYGGGVSVGCGTQNILFQNNIIWGNSSDLDGSQLYCNNNGSFDYIFSNNIIQGGFDSIYFDETFTGQYINNHATNPMFVDTVNFDYHISCGSAALEGGLNFVVQMPPFDIEGNPRLIGSTIDIGAYESDLMSTITSNPNNLVITTGNIATFSIIAVGATSYQWQTSVDFGTNWTNINDNSDYSGTTTANLIVNAIYTMNGNMFRCIAGGQCTGMDVTSNPAIMIVNYNVGIENIEMPIAVYPNPATDFFYIQNASGAELTISDMNGRVVVSRNNISSEKEAISISTLNNGVYFIKITSSNSTQIIRLIKE